MEQLINEIGPPIIAAAVPFIVAFLRRLITRLPKWSLPILAGAIGPALAELLQFFGALDLTGPEQAMIGLVGVGLREVFDQTKKALKPE